VYIHLVPHIVNVNPLMLHHMRGLQIKHRLVPILMEEGPKSLVGALFLMSVVAWPVMESDEIHWILLAVVDFFTVGVNYWGPDLQALKRVRRLGSATTRRGVLRGGLLSERGGSCSLGKLLWVSRGSPARARATDLLALIGTPLMTFASHSLQEGEWNNGKKR
jgi:hypothetical protein